MGLMGLMGVCDLPNITTKYFLIITIYIQNMAQTTHLALFGPVITFTALSVTYFIDNNLYLQ